MRQLNLLIRGFLVVGIVIGSWGTWISCGYSAESPTADSVSSATASIPSATGTNPEILRSAAWGMESQAPLIFSSTQMVQARDQIKRVGWSETLIDSQISAIQAEKVSVDASIWSVWQACLKAALFGEAQRVQSAMNAVAEASREDRSLEESYPWYSFSLLMQSYDCLTALPEWMGWDPQQKEAVQKNMRSFASRYLEKIGDSSQNLLGKRSLQLYAGLLTGATEWANLALLGKEREPGFGEIVRREIMPEGLLRNGSPRSQVDDGFLLLIAGTAVKKCSPELFAQIETPIRKAVEWVSDFTASSGLFPSIVLDPPARTAIVRFLEQSDALFPDLGINSSLSLIYKQHPRLAESLLIGNVLETKAITSPMATAAFPQTGAVILKNATPENPFSFYFDTGLSGYRTSSALLSVECREGIRDSATIPADAGTDAFNTVVIDHTSQAPAPANEDEARNAFLYSSTVFGDGAAYVKATAQGEYTERSAYPSGSVSTPVLTYERTLFYTQPLLVDWFRIRGGKQHDWFYHSPHTLAALPEGEWKPYTVVADDYAWMKNTSEPLQNTVLKGCYGFLFHPGTGSDPSQRIWVIDPAGTQWIVAKNGGQTSLVARREMVTDEGDLFAVVHERIDGNTPPEAKIERLQLDSAVNQRDFQASAIVLTLGKVEHVFLTSMNPTVTYKTKFHDGQIVFQGAFGHIQLNQGSFQRLRLVGGTTLRYDTHGVELDKAINFGVVRRVDSNQQVMDAEFSNLLPSGIAMRGDGMTALSMTLVPVMYRSLIVDQVTKKENLESEKESLETFQLRFQPNAGLSRPSLGAPLTTGDQLVYENYAELILKKDNLYSLEYSAPADVTIAGATDRHRIFFTKADLLRKVRGEFTAGTIQFHLEPKESVQGQVEFASIQ